MERHRRRAYKHSSIKPFTSQGGEALEENNSADILISKFYPQNCDEINFWYQLTLSVVICRHLIILIHVLKVK